MAPSSDVDVREGMFWLVCKCDRGLQGIAVLGKALTCSAPSLIRVSKVTLKAAAGLDLVEQRSFQTLEGEAAVNSCLQSPFLEAISAVML